MSSSGSPDNDGYECFCGSVMTRFNLDSDSSADDSFRL